MHPLNHNNKRVYNAAYLIVILGCTYSASAETMITARICDLFEQILTIVLNKHCWVTSRHVSSNLLYFVILHDVFVKSYMYVIPLKIIYNLLTRSDFYFSPLLYKGGYSFSLFCIYDATPRIQHTPHLSVHQKTSRTKIVRSSCKNTNGRANCRVEMNFAFSSKIIRVPSYIFCEK